MLLYPPAALARAYLYPNQHPLRRRSKVDLTASTAAAAAAWPRFAGEGAWEARLRPGDVLVSARAFQLCPYNLT
jgi:hypothetical protein